MAKNENMEVFFAADVWIFQMMSSGNAISAVSVSMFVVSK